MSQSPRTTATPNLLLASTEQQPPSPFTLEAANLISVLAVNAAADLSRYLRRKQDLNARRKTGLSTRWPLPPDELPVPTVRPSDDYSETDEPFPPTPVSSNGHASLLVSNTDGFGILLDAEDDYRHPSKRRRNSLLKGKRGSLHQREDLRDSSETETDASRRHDADMIYTKVFASPFASHLYRGLSSELGSFGETYYRRKLAHGSIRTPSSRYDRKQTESEMDKDREVVVELEVEKVPIEAGEDEIEVEEAEVEKEINIQEDEDEYETENNNASADEDDQGDADLTAECDQQDETCRVDHDDSTAVSQDRDRCGRAKGAQIEKLPPEYRRTLARQATGQVRHLFEALALLRQTKSPPTPSERAVPASSWKTIVNAAIAAGWPISVVSKANGRLAAFYHDANATS